MKRFTLTATDGGARTGVLSTARGDIRTPAFMPVGTAGTVKALTVDQVAATGADVILGNTYHLMLRPGPERLARLGGLHRFMRWDGPILTDSGGFQVMSLAGIAKMSEAAVTFASHIDGSRHALSPERSIAIQADAIGADIAMQLDECVAWPADRARARGAMELSARWGARSKAAFGARDAQMLFGIQQGSLYEDLRRESADRLQEIGFDGYAIGGLAVGEGHAGMVEVLDYAPAMLPADRPRYLMGVGKPVDIVEAVARGGGHVRLRAAHPLGPPRPGLDVGRRDQPQGRTLRRGRDAAGRRQLMPRQPRLLQGLPASPGEGGGDFRAGAALLAQRRALPGADRGHARGDRGRRIHQLPPSLPRPAGGGRGPAERERLSCATARS